jgi:hypothetical protein
MADYPIDLAYIAAQAAQQQDDNEAFRYYVEDDDLSDSDLDILVERLAAPILAAIDCTQCANCCRHLDVYLTPSDAERLAQGLFIPLESLQTEYIDHPRAQTEDEWGVLAQHPCHFLHGTRCSIYPHRPESCRAYPEFTPDFRWQLGHILGGYGLCPIIYHLIETLKAEMQW